jgi:hypothetical protein
VLTAAFFHGRANGMQIGLTAASLVGKIAEMATKTAMKVACKHLVLFISDCFCPRIWLVTIRSTTA